MSIQRCTYHKSSDRGSVPVQIPVSENFAKALEVAVGFYALEGEAAMTKDALAGEFFQVGLIPWFERKTGMRLGEYLARREAGEVFGWRRWIDGSLRFVSIGNVSGKVVQ